MVESWAPEPIPDGDSVYMRVHVNNTKDGRILPGAFQDHEGSMSTNWKKYCSTPEEARAKARNPALNGVVEAVVGSIRSIPLTVEHSPDLERGDRSHTSVVGSKTTEVRLKLYDAFNWVLPINVADRRGLTSR